MIFVIDGFNLIYKFHDLEEYMYQNELEKAMMGLIDNLAILMQHMKKKPKIYVFFDGKKRPGDFTYQEEIKGIECYYSHDDSADNLIEDFIRTKKMHHVTDLKVISSDKKIQKFTKELKYDYQSSDDFYRWYQEITTRTVTEPEKPETVSGGEIDYWLRIFKKRK